MQTANLPYDAGSSNSSLSKKDQKWESHKGEIFDIYIRQNETLETTIQILEKQGLIGSLRTWKSKLNYWAFLKNLSTNTMQIIVAKEAKRKQEEGKDTAFSYGGVLIKPATIDNFKKRKIAQRETVSPSAETPPNISYHTPGSSHDDSCYNLHDFSNPPPVTSVGVMHTFDFLEMAPQTSGDPAAIEAQDNINEAFVVTCNTPHTQLQLPRVSLVLTPLQRKRFQFIDLADLMLDGQWHSDSAMSSQKLPLVEKDEGNRGTATSSKVKYHDLLPTLPSDELDGQNGSQTNGHPFDSTTTGKDHKPLSRTKCHHTMKPPKENSDCWKCVAEAARRRHNYFRLLFRGLIAQFTDGLPITSEDEHAEARPSKTRWPEIIGRGCVNSCPEAPIGFSTGIKNPQSDLATLFFGRSYSSSCSSVFRARKQRFSSGEYISQRLYARATYYFCYEMIQYIDHDYGLSDSKIRWRHQRSVTYMIHLGRLLIGSCHNYEAMNVYFSALCASLEMLHINCELLQESINGLVLSMEPIKSVETPDAIQRAESYLTLLNMQTILNASRCSDGSVRQPSCTMTATGNEDFDIHRKMEADLLLCTISFAGVLIQTGGVWGQRELTTYYTKRVMESSIPKLDRLSDSAYSCGKFYVLLILSGYFLGQKSEERAKEALLRANGLLDMIKAPYTTLRGKEELQSLQDTCSGLGWSRTCCDLARLIARIQERLSSDSTCSFNSLEPFIHCEKGLAGKCGKNHYRVPTQVHDEKDEGFDDEDFDDKKSKYGITYTESTITGVSNSIFMVP